MMRPFIRLNILAGQAAPVAPISPTLGQHGVNIMKFCKEFNQLTTIYKPHVKLNIKMYINKDKSYQLSIHKPSASFFIKLCRHVIIHHFDNPHIIGLILLYAMAPSYSSARSYLGSLSSFQES